MRAGYSRPSHNNRNHTDDNNGHLNIPHDDLRLALISQLNRSTAAAVSFIVTRPPKQFRDSDLKTIIPYMQTSIQIANIVRMGVLYITKCIDHKQKIHRHTSHYQSLGRCSSSLTRSRNHRPVANGEEHISRINNCILNAKGVCIFYIAILFYLYAKLQRRTRSESKTYTEARENCNRNYIYIIV